MNRRSPTNRPAVTADGSITPAASHAAATRVHGRWLVLARSTWATLAILALGVFIASIPDRFDQLLSVAVRLRAPLEQLGFPHESLAVYITALDLATMVGCAAIATVIFWRKSVDWLALFVSAMLVMYGLAATRPAESLALAQPTLRLLVDFLRALGHVCVLVFCYLVPDGRFVPRWTRPLAVVWAVLVLVWLCIPAVPLNPIHMDTEDQAALPTFLMLLGWFSTGVFAQIYRYRRVSGAMERQQTKWIVYGVAAALLGLVGFRLPALLLPVLRQPGLARLFYLALGIPMLYGSLLLIPIALAIAIMRYRLWQIDLLINRSLVYGTLSALLALVYFSSVVVLQQLLRRLTGQTSQLAIVVSTLAMAGLFQPLRRRIQAFIDRRFYRRKYDAARTIQAFTATLRDEIDLDTLSRSLVAVVDETMQPAHVSLWLRDVRPRRQTEGEA